MRLHVELVLEVAEPEELTGAALDRVETDELMPEEERAHASSSVRDDAAEALAYLVDPFDLIGDVPGVELAQASWSCEQVDYDPDAGDWDIDEEDGETDEDGRGDGTEPARHP